jgi:hypothetical protein
MKALHLDASIDLARESGREFLVTDIALAMTLLERAITTDDADVRRRNIGHALHAYRTVQRFQSRLHLDEAEARQIDQLLAQLRERLDELDGG